MACETQQADDQVAERSYDLGAAAGAGLVKILTERDVSDPMPPVRGRPLSTEPGGQLGRAGLLGGQGRDRVDGLPPQAVALAVVLCPVC